MSHWHIHVIFLFPLYVYFEHISIRGICEAKFGWYVDRNIIRPNVDGGAPMLCILNVEQRPEQCQELFQVHGWLSVPLAVT